jgi:ketosteroid isomerase-like protein
MDDAVRMLIDRAAIRDLLLRYARGVDRKDLALVASCFTPDATYEGALASGTARDALAALPARMGRYESTMHFIGNHLIEFAGDTATSEAYAVAYHRQQLGGRAVDLVVGIRYLDELVRRSDQWLIRHRQVRREWTRSDAVVPPPDPEAAR